MSPACDVCGVRATIWIVGPARDEYYCRLHEPEEERERELAAEAEAQLHKARHRYGRISEDA